MSVYVDNMRRRAQLQGRPANWSHLMADTTEELLAMADSLGLRREWIQHPGTHREHFDVIETKRVEAIRLGAVEIVYPHGTGALLAQKLEGRKLCGSDGGLGVGAGHVCKCNRPAGHPLDSARPHGCPCGAPWADSTTTPAGHDQDAAS